MDGGLHKGVGVSAWRNVDGVVRQSRELAPALPPVDFAQGFHESVILSVADGAFHILLAVDFYFYDGCGSQVFGDRQLVVYQFDALVDCAVLHNVGDDVGQILLRDDFFFVAKFRDALCHFADAFLAQVKSESFKILADIGFARQFAEGIFAGAAEALWGKIRGVEVVLAVAVGMHSGALREHVFADNRLVGRDCNAGV